MACGFGDPSGGHDPAPPAAGNSDLFGRSSDLHRQPDKLYCARVIVTRYR